MSFLSAPTRGTAILFALLVSTSSQAQTVVLEQHVDHHGRSVALSTERVVAAETPEVLTNNRLENPGFASAPAAQLRGFGLYLRGGATGSVEWNAADSAGAADSGSVRLFNNTVGAANTSSQVGVRQCVRPGDVIVGQPYVANMRASFAPGQVPGQGPFEATVWVSLKYYADRVCQSWITSTGRGFVVTPGGSGWTTLAEPELVIAPNLAKSVGIEVYLEKRGDIGPVEAFVDQFSLVGPAAFVKGDFNGDGETDLVLRHQPTGVNGVWLMDNETRGAGPVLVQPTPDSADWQIASIDDFNQDGQNDLLMWNSASGASEFWLMNGTQRTGNPIPFVGALGLPWRPVAAADVDRDGKPDVVWRNTETQKVVIWKLSDLAKVGELVPTPDQAQNANWGLVGAFDLDGNETIDLLWYNNTTGKTVYWLLDASGVRMTGNFTNPPQAVDANWKVVAAGDFGIGPGDDRAGTTDIVWRNGTSGRMVIWFMDRAGNRTAGTFVTPDPNPPATDWTVAGPR